MKMSGWHEATALCKCCSQTRETDFLCRHSWPFLEICFILSVRKSHDGTCKDMDHAHNCGHTQVLMGCSHKCRMNWQMLLRGHYQLSSIVTGKNSCILEESKCHSHLQVGQEEGHRDLNIIQPHPNPWECDGTANLLNHLQAHEE